MNQTQSFKPTSNDLTPAEKALRDVEAGNTVELPEDNGIVRSSKHAPGSAQRPKRSKTLRRNRRKRAKKTRRRNR